MSLQESIFGKKDPKKKSSLGEIKKTLFTKDLDERVLFQKRKKRAGYIKKQLITLSLVLQNKLYVGIGLLCIGLMSVLLLLGGPYFRVKQILISKQDVLTNIEQSYETLEYIRGKNIFLLDGKNLIARLKNAQNSLQSIEIDIDFPSTLLIELKSYPAVFQTSEYFILSNGGIKEKENKNLGDIPLISIISDNPDLFLFGNTLNQNDIENINTLIQTLQKLIPDFSMVSILYYVTEKEILIRNTDNTLLIFDIHQNIKEQAEQLSILKRESPEIYTKKYIYIDVRIPQKIFVCGYEQEFSCKRNLTTIYGVSTLSLPPEIISSQP